MKTHLSFPVRNLSSSIAFYETLLTSPPVKRYDDYALFVVEDPGLELSLTPAKSVNVDQAAHFGVAVESSASVDAAIARLTHAGLEVEVERGQTCCYARQDKVWASDPDGRRWEVYNVIEEIEARDDSDAGCCADRSCA